jgi:hypothetical protein
MSVRVVFRVSTGSSLDGEVPGTGGPRDISRKLSLVGSIPELGAWSLNRRVTVHPKPDLGAYLGKPSIAKLLVCRLEPICCRRGSWSV